MQFKKNARDERYEDLPGAYPVEDDDAMGLPALEPIPQPYRDRRLRETESAIEAPRASEARAASIINADSSFDGRYETAEDLVVLGSIKGEVVCRGLLTIERDAIAKARIEARDARVRGRVEGDLVCSGQLVLASTAVVSGTIKAGTLVVEEGASICGTVDAASSPVATETLTTRPLTRKDVPVDLSEPAPPSGGAPRWTRTREVPTFALVSSDDRSTGDRN
jgi:cytoskeletal protein CcmA (bactofilin family)